MAVVVTIEKPILYKCPYCVKGRFTEDDGWNGAVKHIREKHQNGRKKRAARGGEHPGATSSLEDLDLLEGAAFG